MFTGIIEQIGQVHQFEKQNNCLQLGVHSQFTDIQRGESIAVNGVCLTVTDFSPTGDLFFFVSPETLEKSNLDSLQVGTFLNLERALTLQTRLSGHFLQGHVDGVAEFLDAQPKSECHTLRFRISESLAKYTVPKGSIGINGISLTLNEVQDCPHQKNATIEIMVIPYTWTHTNLSKLQPQHRVNIEVDILAKYVERLCQR